MATVVEPEILSGPILETFKAILTDEHATVKLIAIESLVKYVTLLKKAASLSTLQGDLVPVIKSTTDDSSWKIRLAVAKEYCDLGNCFDSIEINTELCNGAMILIQDPEPDVRTNALKGVTNYLRALGPDIFLPLFTPVAAQLV